MEENEIWGQGASLKTVEKEFDITGSNLGENVQQMVNILIDSCDQMYNGTFDNLRAERVAALALKARMIMADFLKESELKSRQFKNNLKLVRAETKYKYIQSALKDGNKKPSDASLEVMVEKDNAVCEAEDKLAELELETKKWQNVLGIAADTHVYFRNLNKN